MSKKFTGIEIRGIMVLQYGLHRPKLPFQDRYSTGFVYIRLSKNKFNTKKNKKKQNY